MIDKDKHANFVKEIRKKTGKSQRDFAECLEVSGAYIGQIETGDSYLSEKVYGKIINRFKNYLSDDKQNNTTAITYLPDVYLSAGYGVENYNENKQKMLIDTILLTSEKGLKINPDNCEIVRISGNSMFPEYRHGDRVIIDRGDTTLSDGHIYAFRYKNECYVKEINLMGDRIKCISLNKDYDPFYINKNEDFVVFGKILPRIRL